MRKLVVKSVLTAMLAASFSSVAHADNPVIRDVFTADPAALVHRDRVYLYTGHDEASPNGNFFVMKDWLIFSSEDMVQWTKEGSLSVTETFSWAQPNSAWASQVAERDGKFYWYVTALNKDGSGYAIGVAVSDHPTQGFTDALGKPLISSEMTRAPESMGSVPWDDIDPSVFIDDDGQAYLYWGNTICRYAKLKDNMTELDGDIHTITINNMPTTFTEAPWVHKHNGHYYLSFAQGYPEQLAYAMSDSPEGPWEYKGVLLDPLAADANDTAASNTSHQSIIDFKGRSYFIYHTSALPTGGQYRRSVSMEQLFYNPDGTIRKLAPTSTGIDGVSHRLQAYGSQDRYIRHYNGDVRVDPAEGFRSDSRWQLVPGLAESGEGIVSFQAMDRPGYYLLSRGSDVVLAKHDGTEAFKNYATFRSVAGLADSSWASYRAYSNPDAYLISKDFALSLGAAGTDADKQNATFRPLQADAEGVALDLDSVSLQTGADTTLTASVIPLSAVNRDVTFTVSNPQVAALSTPVYDAASGTVSVTVTGKAEGTAEIIGWTAEGQFTDAAVVTVVNASTDPGAIQGVSAGIHNGTREVTLAGTLHSDGQQEVAVRVTAPNGEVDYVDQVTAGAEGEFSLRFRLQHSQPGSYMVQLGAADVEEPVQTSFIYRPADNDDDDDNDDGGNGGGSSGGTSGPGGGGSGTAAPSPAPSQTPAAPSAPQPSPAQHDSPKPEAFSDIGKDFAWASEAIQALAAEGFIKGSPDGTFNPAGEITRADFVVLLVRLLGLKSDSPGSFTDVPKDAYYYEAVGTLKALGITNGIGEGRFDPSGKITRQDLMVLLARALTVTDKMQLDVGSSQALQSFTDANQVADYAADSVSAFVEHGLVQGSGEEIQPRSSATRAETAVLLHRIWLKLQAGN
ncbi:family 43 glycosylhydrolase [Paenibacillus turpanensis]|uniref:family 43 glycosylhydrolase n=1 Tax=Paenibacillus turpanensis TaxID=2689078 RepID=UPI00140D8363|nr:family 43 glycosylhydrolase [Paenibacillus turpanensis]